MNIETGKGTITLKALIAIWSVSALTSLPGLAVSPILDKLTKVFPNATEMELQMLTSLPSLLIIPFVLLSGHLAERVGFVRSLLCGLWLFLISGILYFLCNAMWQLIAVSVLLGVGTGIIIPLSTALVSRYFVGEYRTRQFGYSSAITNASLVIATALTGYLANIQWRLPFAVYLLPAVSIMLVPFLSREKGVDGTSEEATKSALPVTNYRALAMYSAYYLFITYLIVVINFNLPFLMGEYKLGSGSTGVVTSLFFLSIMLPGFFLPQLLRIMRGHIAQYCLALIGLGLWMIYLYGSVYTIAIGCIICGFGYGVAQPYLYDRCVAVAPRNTSFALAIIMAMNYIAIVVAPFIVDNLQKWVASGSQRFPFGLNAALSFIGIVILFVVNIFTECRRCK